jgi:DNA primase
MATKKHKDVEQDVTLYPLINSAEHLANQGAIELHAPAGRVPALYLPDRLVIDLDPPEQRSRRCGARRT